MTDRLTLAKDLFVAYMKAGKPIQIETSFLLADDFLLQDSKQREKAAPPPDHDCDGYKCEHISHYPERCNHNWCSINGGPTHCLHCGTPKVKPEPPKPEPNCEHKWVSDGGECYYCQKCNEPKAKKPEPPKPERKAREVWVCFNSAGIPMYAWNEQDRDKTRMLFREILPEDGK